MRFWRSTAVIPAACVAAFTLGACGTQSGSASDDTSPPPSASASSTPTDQATPPLPDCTAIWVEGQDLPGNYRGCSTEPKPTVIQCESGQRLITYDDHFWAVRGHVIAYAADGLESSGKYTSVIQSCRA